MDAFLGLTDKRGRYHGRRVLRLRSFGKQFLVKLSGQLTVRLHLLMFGSYRINEGRDIAPRLDLHFDRGELNFYSCSVGFLAGDLETAYDWRGNVMSDRRDPKLARAKPRKTPHTLVCDVLLDQTIFAGVGNIIKNEALFRIRVHPLSTVGALSTYKLRQLVNQARVYAFEFWPGGRHTFWPAAGWSTTAVVVHATTSPL